MSRPLRILHVLWRFDLGGLERVVAELSRASDPDAFAFSVLTLSGHGLMARETSSQLPLHTAVPQGRFSLLRPAALAKQIRALRPDIVHTHSGVWLKAARAARMAGVQSIVHTDHGRPHPDPLGARVADRLGAMHTDAIVAVSAPLAAYLRQRVLGRGKPVQTIPNGVDTSVFRPDPAAASAIRQSLGVTPDTPLIGSVGRLESVKAYDRLLRAVVAVGEGRRPPAHLVLVGDGSQLRALSELASSTAPERIHLVGRQADIARWLSALDVFALASDSEGTSMSLLEAMACGCCPVVTAVGGSPDVLGDELRHRLVSAGSEASLIAGLRDALDDPPARSADGKRARERVRDTFDLGAMRAAYGALYKTLAAAV